MFSSQALSHLSGLTHPLQGAKITTNSSHFAKFAFGAHIRLSIPVSRPQYSREYWEDVKRGLDWGFGNGPDMIADCGGDIVLLISEGIEAEKLYEETGELLDPSKTGETGEAPSPLDFCFSPPNSRLGTLRSFIRDELKDDPSRYRRILKNLVGISQITSTGAVRILKKRADGTLFESSNIYESVTKTKFDNWYGSHIPLPKGLEKAIGGPIANKNVVLCGYGYVGKNCADALKEAGANVFVIKNNNPDQNDPDHALDAIMEGIQVKTLDEIVSEGDIFITTTDSKDIITVDHMKKMKDNAVICSTGQFDNVIDMQGLETGLNVRRITVGPHANKWIFPETNDGIIVWAGGRIMNLGSATGNPCFVESCPHVDQVIGLIELWKEKDVQNLNRECTSESFPILPNNLDVQNLNRECTSESFPSLPNNLDVENLNRERTSESFPSLPNNLDVQNLNRERTSENFPSLPNNLDVHSTTLPSLSSLRKLYNSTHPLQGAKISLSPTTTTTTTKTLTALGAEIRDCTPNFLTHLNPAGGSFVTLKNQNPHVYWEYVKRTLDWGPNLITENSGDLTLFIREGIKAEKMYEETGHLPYTYSLCAEPEKMYKETRHLPDPYSLCVDTNFQALRTIIRNGLESDPNKYRRMVNNLAGISQITPTGAVRILKMRDDGSMFEPINLYDSVSKTKFDNWYGSHLSLPEGLKRAIGGPIANKKVVLCGYGNFGKGCADALEKAGANVFIIKNNHECDSSKDGIQVKTLDEIVPVGDIFITTTDTEDIITVDHMKRMKNNAFICSTGQFDNVIDMQRLETYPYVSKITVNPHAKKWVFQETNNGVIILAEGRMMNLGGASGNPKFVEPCPDIDQVIGLMELWKQMGGIRDA